MVHELEDEYWGQIEFIFLDIDDPRNEGFIEELNYRARPQFALIDRNGEVVREWFGPPPADDMRAAFDELLASDAAN